MAKAFSNPLCHRPTTTDSGPLYPSETANATLAATVADCQVGTWPSLKLRHAVVATIASICCSALVEVSDTLQQRHGCKQFSKA
jgi:hypothetical protein